MAYRRLKGNGISASSSILFCAAFGVAGCGDVKPEDYLRADLLSIGFIPYSTPIAFAGTGTIVDGAYSKKMGLVSAPHTCFPDEIDGVKTGLRFIEKIALPNRSSTYRVSGNARIGLIDALGKGNLPIKAGVNFSTVQTIEFSYTQPQREFIDRVILASFYRTKMPQNQPDGSNLCKDLLDEGGFISEAIKVEKMTFKFFKAEGVQIDLEAVDSKTLLELGAGFSGEVIKKYELVIDAPKYIGYKLSELKKRDNGLSICTSGALNTDDSYDWDCIHKLVPAPPQGEVTPFFSPVEPTKLKFLKKVGDLSPVRKDAK